MKPSARRYYDDSYTRQFTANAIETSTDADGAFAVLDETYFYPTSGGQPHDLGTLGNANVVNVRIREADQAVLHMLDAPIGVGPVTGTIDNARRFDYMQQHTGQHILSQAFLRAANAATIGFHLGAETVSIDLDSPTINDASITVATNIANEIIGANVAIRSWFPSAEELESLALRKMPEVNGPLRVVAIGDFDFSACGGTHVTQAAEVGLVSVLRTERMKRGMRVEFLCGHRARADYARKHATVRELSAALSCAPEGVAEAVAKLSAAMLESRRALGVYRERDLDEEARHLAESAQRHGTLEVVSAVWSDRSVDDVKGLAHRLTSLSGIVALFGIAGPRTQLLFARSEDVTADLKSVFQAALAEIGEGKGGGARILMGSGKPVSADLLKALLERSAETLAT